LPLFEKLVLKAGLKLEKIYNQTTKNRYLTVTVEPVVCRQSAKINRVIKPVKMLPVLLPFEVCLGFPHFYADALFLLFINIIFYF
jgi:hypothetical protein